MEIRPSTTRIEFHEGILEGQWVEVFNRPLARKVKAAEREQLKAGVPSKAAQICMYLKDWSLTDEHGVVLPVSAESVGERHFGAVQQLFDAILSHTKTMNEG